MSFLKTVAIVGAAIALLPSDRESQHALKMTALSAGAQARSFCETRPNICLSREEAWALFTAKASFAYDLGSELIWGQQPGHMSFRQHRDSIDTLLQSERGDL